MGEEILFIDAIRGTVVAQTKQFTGTVKSFQQITTTGPAQNTLKKYSLAADFYDKAGDQFDASSYKLVQLIGVEDNGHSVTLWQIG